MIFTIGKSFGDRVREFKAQELKRYKNRNKWHPFFLYFPFPMFNGKEYRSNQWAFMRWVYRKKITYQNRGEQHMWVYSLTDLTPTEDETITGEGS